MVSFISALIRLYILATGKFHLNFQVIISFCNCELNALFKNYCKMI